MKLFESNLFLYLFVYALSTSFFAYQGVDINIYFLFENLLISYLLMFVAIPTIWIIELIQSALKAH